MNSSLKIGGHNDLRLSYFIVTWSEEINDGLSGGAIAGIAAGAAGFVVITAAIGVYCYRKKKNSKKYETLLTS
jgi:hypothetical protein